MTDINLQKLAEEFPRERVSWRAQTVTKSAPYKALALAYIDARDVMERLDSVCGLEGWQSEHYDAGSGRLGCRIGILLPKGIVHTELTAELEHWVWKSDGAGATAVEADKGAFSDAFKRAAVQWGIGRYLYELDSPWVPCEAFVGQDGKPRFKKFTADPWSFVRKTTDNQVWASEQDARAWRGPLGKHDLKTKMREFATDLQACTDLEMMAGVQESHKDVLHQCASDLPDWWDGTEEQKGAAEAIVAKQAELQQVEKLRGAAE